MLFNSYVFVLFFLPLTCAGYFLLNKKKWYRAAQAELIAASLYFYSYFNRSYLLIISGSIVCNYVLSQMMLKAENKKKFILGLSVSGNVGLLFYFKYWDFFVENINALFHASFELRHILLPLGISFYTIQQISYAVDSYRGETAGYSFLDYAQFVSFFPQLVAGPIVLHREMIPQFWDEKNKKPNAQNMADGLHDFAIGLFKKVIIADTFGQAVAWGFAPDRLPALTSMEAVIVMFSYTFQIYFDFSGYCDMASGIASMFNMKLPLNFNSPYKSCSILEFWKRWHMSLTRFLREYVYFPLGGSRNGRFKTYRNIMTVYVISGIWHGANWTFLAWGGVHGLACVLNRMFQKSWDKLNQICQWVLTFGFVNLAWVFFRADSIADACVFLKQMAGLGSFQISDGLISSFQLSEIHFLMTHVGVLSYLNVRVRGLWMWLLFGIAFWTVWNLKNCSEIEKKSTICRGVVTVICMVWSIVSFGGISTFLYFNF